MNYYRRSMEEKEIKILQDVIDELRIESRKLEYSSALERLTRRVNKLEEQIELIKTILKKHYE